ncbi:MAG: hypothetical protein RUDDFDWM_001039 [Candidatus Fervidibacterota bacterium]
MKSLTRFCLVLPLALLIVTQGPLQSRIHRQRQTYKLLPPVDVLVLYQLMPAEAITITLIGTMLGGFRGVAAKMLWLKSDEYWHSGRWYSMLPIMRTITWLDPNFIQAWDIAGWHVAYNLRAEAKTEEQQDEYVRKGCEILEEGIRWNPKSWQLLFQLGWTHYDKSGNLEEAIKWFKLARPLEDWKPGDLPRTHHMIAHAYERLPDIPKALKTWKDDFKYPHFCGANKGAVETITERYVIPWKLMEQGQYEKAISLMDKLLEKPELRHSSIVRHVLAEIYRRMGDLETAQAIMEEWSKKNKLDAGARYKAKLWKKLLAEQKQRKQP